MAPTLRRQAFSPATYSGFRSGRGNFGFFLRSTSLPKEYCGPIPLFTRHTNSGSRECLFKFSPRYRKLVSAVPATGGSSGCDHSAKRSRAASSRRAYFFDLVFIVAKHVARCALAVIRYCTLVAYKKAIAILQQGSEVWNEWPKSRVSEAHLIEGRPQRVVEES